MTRRQPSRANVAQPRMATQAQPERKQTARKARPSGTKTPARTAQPAEEKGAAAEITFTAGPNNGKPERLVIAHRDGVDIHRDRLDTNKAERRDVFLDEVARKIGADPAAFRLSHYGQLVSAADAADLTRTALEQEAKSDAKAETDSQSGRLVKLADTVDRWHTPGMDGYATVRVGNHLENWPIRSKQFKMFLQHLYYVDNGRPANSQALEDATGVLESQARYDGEQHSTHVRIAEQDGVIYLDLGDTEWQAIRIDAFCWEVVEDPPVRFRRPKGMLPLPMPRPEGSIELLRPFVNVTDDCWPLVKAWAVAALRPRGPFPVAGIHGEQGSAKSTTARILRQLIDPNQAPLRSPPKSDHDLLITANNSWAIVFDNLSRIPQWLSDGLCRLSTGGGFATRKLFEDDEETIFNAQRPIVLTGITEVATSGDLIDRSLIMMLPTIRERRPEAEFWDEFAQYHALILGALLNGVSNGLANMPTVELSGLPRMADFAQWAVATEVALESAPGTFMSCYASNQNAANDLVLEASLIAKPLLDLLAADLEWQGTATDLLNTLARRVQESVLRQREWPSGPKSLSDHLMRIAPNLRAAGWNVGRGRRGAGRGRPRLLVIQPVAERTQNQANADEGSG
jgi:hypothetical protein